jgi:hypothetical protein
MARHSLLKNPSLLVNVKDGASSSECVKLFARATGLSENAARENLLVNGFYRYVALATYSAKKAPAKKHAKK